MQSSISCHILSQKLTTFGLFMSVNHLHHTKWFKFTILKDVLQNSFVLLCDQNPVTAFPLSNSVMEYFCS
jgi:hypothetical protein